MIEKLRDNISKKLRMRRALLRKTLREMAETSGVSYNTVQTWEKKAPRFPQKEVVEKLAKTYEIDIGEFFVKDVDSGGDAGRGVKTGADLPTKHESDTATPITPEETMEIKTMLDAIRRQDEDFCDMIYGKVMRRFNAIQQGDRRQGEDAAGGE